MFVEFCGLIGFIEKCGVWIYSGVLNGGFFGEWNIVFYWIRVYFSVGSLC